jgi:hypothetical protein
VAKSVWVELNNSWHGEPGNVASAQSACSCVWHNYASMQQQRVYNSFPAQSRHDWGSEGLPRAPSS